MSVATPNTEPATSPAATTLAAARQDVVRERLRRMVSLQSLYAPEGTALCERTVRTRFGKTEQRERDIKWEHTIRVYGEYVYELCGDFNLSVPEIVEVAFSHMIRYYALVRPSEVRKRTLSLTCLSALVIAVKTHNVLSTISFKDILKASSMDVDEDAEPSELVQMEGQMLAALNWHLHPVLATQFVEHMAPLVGADEAIERDALATLRTHSNRFSLSLFCNHSAAARAAGAIAGAFEAASNSAPYKKLASLAECSLQEIRDAQAALATHAVSA